MAQTADIHVKIDPTTKTKAVKVLDLLGMTPSQVISALYQQIIYTKSIPFEIKIPNELTAKTLEKVEAGENVVEFSNVDELLKELKS